MVLVLLTQVAGSAQRGAHEATLTEQGTTQTVTPYTFILHFPDSSIEICYSTGFAFNYPAPSDIEVQDCVGDDIFKNGFE